MPFRLSPTAPVPEPATQPAGARVLIVDDVPEICQFFRDVAKRIRGTEFTVTTECNSKRALEFVQAEEFDIVLSDFRMREVDGIEVLKAAHAHNPEGLRILMTGYNEIPTSIVRIQAARVDAYIQKPLQAQELLLLLTGFLHKDAGLLASHREAARQVEAMASPEPENDEALA